MINFSSISKKSILGELLRFLLKFIPPDIEVPILQGRLMGKKWIKGSGVNGYWLGTYELNQQKVFEKNIKEGDVVFDVGANSGFYSLLAAELVGSKGRVFAFEPLSRNVYYLKKNIKINNYNNVDIIELAIFDKKGEVIFKEGVDNSTGRINEGGNIVVKTESIDNMVADKKLLPPTVMKIDVEGAELDVLKGAYSTIKKYHPQIFLSIHRFTENIHKDCCDFLENLGYKLSSLNKKEVKSSDEILAQ